MSENTENSEEKKQSAKTPGQNILVKDLSECPFESRSFLAIIKSIVEISSNICRLHLIDSEGDSVFCLLLNDWVKKKMTLKKGYTLCLSPSKILKVPDEHKSFYSPIITKTSSAYYFHYDDDNLGLKVLNDISPLSQAEILGHTGTSAIIMGVVMDIKIEIYEKSLIYMLKILDCTIEFPISVRVQQCISGLNIADVVVLYSVVFCIEMSQPIAIVSKDCAVEVHKFEDAENDGRFGRILEDFKGKSERIMEFDNSGSMYFCVLSMFDGFPEAGKNLFIVYDYQNYYFLVTTHLVKAKWLKVTGGRIFQNSVVANEFSCVCGIPEWMMPIRKIVQMHEERLKIVRKEAVRKTSFFNNIHIDL